MYVDAFDALEAVYVCRFRPGAETDSDADYAAHVAGLSAAAERTESHVHRLLVVIIQEPGYPVPNAQWRKKIANMTSADNFAPIVAFVSANPLIRGVLTAIAWLSKPKYEQSVLSTVSEALEWLERRRARPVPRLRELVREVTAA